MPRAPADSTPKGDDTPTSETARATAARGPYRGRFAPSPTGALHQGSLISALASYLDARAHDGEWLIRIEDIDGPRAVPGIDEDILQTLAAYGMRADARPIWQHTRTDAYQQAFDRLQQTGLLYPCGCTRREIADSLIQAQDRHQRNTTLAYPGTCRSGLHGRTPRAWRLRVPDGEAAVVCFDDRWQRQQIQDLANEVGDFALKRADGLWAYQLAVVVDDAASGITDIVRGSDLLDSTPRQIYLQRCLGLPTPRYLHIPVRNNAAGEKLSKQNGATALPRDPIGMRRALLEAAGFLGLDRESQVSDALGMASASASASAETISLEAFLTIFYPAAIAAWRERWSSKPAS